MLKGSAMSSPHPDRPPPVPTRPWPLLSSLSGYKGRNVAPDVMAGLTLAAVAIPEQMATARLAGLTPEIGFLAFIAGALGFALFGANRFLSVGADSTIAPIFAAGLVASVAAGAADYAALAETLALAVGVILVVAGLLRLGWVADLLSVPVTTGFLAGISVHIIVSQLPTLLGVPPPAGSLLRRMATLALGLGQTNAYDAVLGIAVFALTVGAERLSARIPGALIGLVTATALVLLGGLESRGVAVLGAVPSAWLHLVLPAAAPATWLRVLPLALVVAVVVMLQTAATTRAFPSDPGQAPAVDRDFLGVGASNLLAGLFGAFPVDASPPRTAIVAETGGRSQLAGLLAAAMVLGLLAFGTELLAHIPQAALAGVLLFIALRIFRLRRMIEVYRRTGAEFALILATLAAIVVLPIETGIGIGIVLSLTHGMWTMTRAQPVEFERVPGTSIWWAPTPHAKGETEPSALVIAFQAPLSFLNAYSFQHGVLELIAHRAKRPDLVVLEASSIIAIDFTAAEVVAAIIRQCRSAGVVLAVARLESVRAQAAFRQFGLLDLLGADHLFLSVEDAVRALARPGSTPSGSLG